MTAQENTACCRNSEQEGGHKPPASPANICQPPLSQHESGFTGRNDLAAKGMQSSTRHASTSNGPPIDREADEMMALVRLYPSIRLRQTTAPGLGEPWGTLRIVERMIQQPSNLPRRSHEAHLWNRVNEN